MKIGKTEKARILVAFGDIRGFTNFCDLVTDEETEFDPFFHEFDRLVEETEHETGYRFDDTGDGYMCVVDLAAGHACTRAGEALVALYVLFEKISQLMARKDPPGFAGFCVVGAYGYVRRKVRKSGFVSLRGRQINLAHNSMELVRGFTFWIHDTWKQLMSDKQIRELGFKLVRVKVKGPLPDSISRQDANSYWVVTRLEAEDEFIYNEVNSRALGRRMPLAPRRAVRLRDRRTGKRRRN